MDTLGGLNDIFGGSAEMSSSYVPPQEVWLAAAKGKGMEVTGTFSRRNKQIFMELTVSNKAMQPMMGLAIQLNKNRY